MPRVICTLPNASTSIDGVAYEPHPHGGMISEEIDEAAATRLAGIPGFRLTEEKAQTKAQEPANPPVVTNPPVVDSNPPKDADPAATADQDATADPGKDADPDKDQDPAAPAPKAAAKPRRSAAPDKSGDQAVK